MTDDDLSGRSLLDIGSEYDDPLEEMDERNSDDSFTFDESDSMALQKVRRAVRDYGREGITVSELEEVTELSPKTIRRHLDTLRRLREVYRQKRNKQMYLYYPNGTPLHSFGKKRVEGNETMIDVQLAERDDGEYFFHLTEKRFSLIEGETVEGAIIVPMESIDELCDRLQEFKDEVET